MKESIKRIGRVKVKKSTNRHGIIELADVKERILADFCINLFIEGQSAVKNDTKITCQVRGMDYVAAKGYRRDDLLELLRIAN